MIILQVILIFLGIQPGLCDMTEKLYKQAEQLYDAQYVEYYSLYRKYNISQGDYSYDFASGSVPRTTANKKAEILLNFQYMVKDKKTYRSMLKSAANKFPRRDRCPAIGKCDRHLRFSPIGGFCNNLKYPKYGAAKMPYQHLLTPAFLDGISEIRETTGGEPLPNSRVIGNVLAKRGAPNPCEKIEITTGYWNNQASLFFGQLATHDISMRNTFQIDGNSTDAMNCCKKDNSGPLPTKKLNPHCIPISYPRDDPFFSKVNIYCYSHARLRATLDKTCKINHIQHENLRSGYFDLSMIYSDEIAIMKSLRTNSGGRLKMNAKNILPEDQCSPGSPDICYVGGDPRVKQTIPFGALNSIFFRGHNLIADGLTKVNPHWDDEELFYQSRRLLTAMFQVMLYNEWLPLVIGLPACVAKKLVCNRKRGKCDQYNEKIDTCTTSEFAHAAFRIFHDQVENQFNFYDKNYKITKKFKLSETLSKSRILETNLIDAIRGLIKMKIRSRQTGYADEMRNSMFPVMRNGYAAGVDQMVLDMTRDRESGNRSYRDYFKWAGLGRIRKWEDLKPYFLEKNYNILKELYENVADVELMVGLLLEDRCETQAGPVATAIIAEQFYRFKYGDQFFYSHETNPQPFTKAQLTNLESFTFSKMVCMTVGNISQIQKQGFVVPMDGNPYVSCSDLPGIDFSLYKERS